MCISFLIRSNFLDAMPRSVIDERQIQRFGKVIPSSNPPRSERENVGSPPLTPTRS
jgi:hypothetical protein